jgi:hypothetical protein
MGNSNEHRLGELYRRLNAALADNDEDTAKRLIAMIGRVELRANAPMKPITPVPIDGEEIHPIPHPCPILHPRAPDETASIL